jgi:hypothetical protein
MSGLADLETWLTAFFVTYYTYRTKAVSGGQGPPGTFLTRLTTYRV